VVDGGDIIVSTMINRTHNHVKYCKELDLWIHRKGATHAENDMFGIIPGNMRDGSFVVRGLGCLDSLYSASHGAGRTMSRTQAKKELNIEEFVADMDGIYAEPTLSTLDESPRAYKSIASVMKHQTEMVEVIEWIKPLINVKG
jgi:tRNA-splicing ligase RtcB